MPRTVYLLTKSADGKKTFWNRAGVAFDPNQDNSVNFKLDMFPHLTFQVRDNSDRLDHSPEYNQEERHARR